jgi:glycosyltransferase involved in cell wall biosynthesis
MYPLLSVIICTHNPRPNYIKQVLNALKIQTLPIGKWELLLIDNSSDQLLSSEINLSWHPQSRHIREDKLGLTYARLRGIQEFRAKTLIFVDDDNVLGKGYLESALQIDQDWPMVGAWGGETIPQFEKPAPEWSRPYWPYLGIRELESNKWGNLMQWENTPIGAGLCIRRRVAERYFQFAIQDSKRLKLDRCGDILFSCGDMDLAYTSLDLGLGIGRFKSLNLIHLIPPFRLEEKYFQKLIKGTVYSQTILLHLRGHSVTEKEWQINLKLAMPWLIHPKSLLVEPRARSFGLASKEGYLMAIKDILKKKF